MSDSKLIVSKFLAISLYIGLSFMTSQMGSCKSSIKKVKARHRDGSTAVLFEYPDKEDTLTYIMKTYYSDGKLQRQATVKDGKFTGNIKEYWPNGNMQQLDSLLEPCDVKTQNCNEVLLRYHENGSLSQRFTETNGVLSGLAEQYDSTGVLKIAYHLKDDSVKDGEFIQYYNNGNVAVKATYQMGKMVGEEYFFQESGDTLRYFQIRDGKPSIPLAEWLENGTVVKGDYINDKRNAVLWKWYDKRYPSDQVHLFVPLPLA